MARVSAGSRRTTTEDFTMIRSIFSIAIIACLALCVLAFDRVRGSIKAAWSWLRDISPMASKQPKPKCHPALVQAKAFVTRLAKRARPTVTPTWRMCPST